MELNVEWYGYGVGLVSVGWVCGYIVGMVAKILNRASNII